MKLTQKHLDIIKKASHRASISIAKLAEDLPYKPHVVRRTLEELLRHGYLHRSIFVDFYRLGFTCQNTYFSIPSRNARSRDEIVKWITNYPNITWFAEVAGRFQYQLTMLCKSPGDMAVFWEKLSEKFGSAFEERLSSAEIMHNFFGRKFLGDKQISIPPIVFSETPERVQIDTLDWNLLNLLASPEAPSVTHIARTLKVPVATLTYRKERLESEKVLSGVVYLVNRNVTDYVSFDILIYARNLSRNFIQAFLAYCKEQPNFYHCHRCIGSWDFKTCLEGLPRDQVVEALQELRSKFEGNITAIEVIPILREIRDSLCPKPPSALTRDLKVLTPPAEWAPHAAHASNR